MECTTAINTLQTKTVQLYLHIRAVNSAAPVQPVYTADLYQPVRCRHMCCYENLALLYNKTAFHRIDLATQELLEKIKFTVNVTRTCLRK